jgi:hypothetical protein
LSEQVPNVSVGGNLISYLEVHFLDENGRLISRFPVPFAQGAEIPERILIMKPRSSRTFTYNYDSLLRYSENPDKTKKLKIEYYILHQANNADGERIKMGFYEQSVEFAVP